MRKAWAAVTRTGIVLGVLALTMGAKPLPLPNASPASDVPRGKPPPLAPGEEGGSASALPPAGPAS